MLVRIAAAVLLASLSLSAAPACDRACMTGLVDQYLAALVKHDPAGLPFAANLKYTENAATIPMGDGLWVGAEAPVAFQIHVIDPVAGQAGFFGILKEFGRPVMLGLRLKVEDRKITEVEQVVARDMAGADYSNLIAPRPAWLTPVPAAERTPRDVMLRAADGYFEAIEQDRGSAAPFADDCARHEHGIRTANNPTPPFDWPDWRKKLNSRTCSAQIDTQSVSYITKIQPRRLLIIDEELGIVYGFPMFIHRGDIRTIKIVGVPGVDTILRDYHPFNLLAAEMFKIRSGKIHEIEALGAVLPYMTKNGWE